MRRLLGHPATREAVDMVRAGDLHAAPARTVELLYIDGCPHYEALLPCLYALMRSAGEDHPIHLRRIPDASAAVRERFLGSPTVRVDGRDVEPGASQRHDFGMKCRLYATADGLRTLPLDDWVVAALERPSG